MRILATRCTKRCWPLRGPVGANKRERKKSQAMNMIFERKLPIPMEVKEKYPLTAAMEERVQARRLEVAKVFTGEDDRLILIIGPCSADNEDSVMDYVMRLVPVQEKVQDKIIIIPRIYTNKPRTTGKGYKGLVHQPDPNGRPDAFSGVLATRELHMRALAEAGFPCADEMLYPENYKYLDDVLGYVAVGARSVENQQHRLVASGIEVPVGMKNPTSGDLSVMMNSIVAAQSQHDFIYRGWAAQSQGNPLAHAIMRGFTDESGATYPNYHYENLTHLLKRYEEHPELANPAVIIDCNHANSHKNPFEQPRIMKEVLNYCAYNPEIKRLIKGFMVESYIEDGNQPVDGGIYGKSITDACLGWEKTERLIYDIAEML
ncbi:MAG: 3-deoxy-7-phosphoheptulonate synthase [Coriobacteriia bacterium]|nr:3-deoxy-7-phosphoheptulonate synthase [Coriobacteriia bacterium]